MTGETGGERNRRMRFIERLAAMRSVDTRAAPSGRPAAELESLRVRVDHLEAALEGLQDAVYREGRRHEAEIQELQRQTDPAVLARALEAHVRKHGL
jgi:hypothetical protein